MKRILLDACVDKKMWKNLTNQNILLLKLNNDYTDASDAQIIRFARKNNLIVLTQDRDFYDKWLIHKNFNLIYVRNTKLSNPFYLDSAPKMSNEHREYRQKIVETYICYIQKYLSNNLKEETNNFCLRLGEFNHGKVNCLSELIIVNRDFVLEEKNKNKSFLTSSLVINDKNNNHLILTYKDVETGFFNTRLQDYKI